MKQRVVEVRAPHFGGQKKSAKVGQPDKRTNQDAIFRLLALAILGFIMIVSIESSSRQQ